MVRIRRRAIDHDTPSTSERGTQLCFRILELFKSDPATLAIAIKLPGRSTNRQNAGHLVISAVVVVTFGVLRRSPLFY